MAGRDRCANLVHRPTRSVLEPEPVLSWSLAQRTGAGQITLSVPAARVQVWALDERGKRRVPLKMESDGKKARFRIGPENRTLWYEVEIARPTVRGQ